MNNLRLVVVNTTAYNEENFSLITDLLESQIIEVMLPIVEAERQDDKYYDNDDLVDALTTAYPKNFIQQAGEGDLITI